MTLLSLALAMCFYLCFHLLFMYVGRYSRLLAHYPYLVVAGVGVFSLTCLIVALTVSDTPGFSDPKLVSTVIFRI